jgi:D-alanine-D-alanine ligase
MPVVAGRLACKAEVAARHLLEPPYVVKPNAEGSSVGVFLVREGANTPPQELAAPGWVYGEQVMVEPYIPGRELCVAVLGEASGPRALTVTDITPTKGFYDYEAKYAPGGSTHKLPADLPAHVFEAALRQAELAHAAMGCRGVSRTDFRYDDLKDVLVLLEVNTQPGKTPTSHDPEQAAHAGIENKDLVRWMVEDASCPR